MKTIKFIIEEPTYQSRATFFIGHTFKQFSAIVEKYRHADEKPIDKDLRDVNGLAVTMRNKDDLVCHIVWLKFFNWTIPQLGILAHEIAHTAFAVLHHKNVPIRIENDETFCYLFEHYYKGALRKLSKTHKEKKEKKNGKQTRKLG